MAEVLLRVGYFHSKLNIRLNKHIHNHYSHSFDISMQTRIFE